MPSKSESRSSANDATNAQRSTTSTTTQPRSRNSSSSSLFRIPRPLKRLFDAVPLVTYPANELPIRSPGAARRQKNVLYIFTSEEGARRGTPSWNPGCLRWQTYLKFLHVEFLTVASNNHASPSGSLPFLIPASASAAAAVEADGVKSFSGDKYESAPYKDTPVPISSGKLQKWALKEARNAGAIDSELEKNGGIPDDTRYEAYMSLLEGKIRRAWLYTLYLSPANRALSKALYITPTSTSSFIQIPTAFTLLTAASSSLLSSSTNSTSSCSTPITFSSPNINESSIFEEAATALDALDTLLGDNEWFFDARKPGMLDAAVFGYTFLAWERGMKYAMCGSSDEGVVEAERASAVWGDDRLGKLIEQRKNLAWHRERIWETWYR